MLYLIHNLWVLFLENFVITELIKHETWNTTRVQLYYMRTASDIEVDIVLEDASGNIVGLKLNIVAP